MKTINVSGAEVTDFNSIDFRGIKKIIKKTDGTVESSEQIVNGRASMGADAVGQVLTPDEIQTLADLLGKIADASEGFKQAKSDEIAKLNALGVDVS